MKTIIWKRWSDF